MLIILIKISIRVKILLIIFNYMLFLRNKLSDTFVIWKLFKEILCVENEYMRHVNDCILTILLTALENYSTHPKV